MSIEQVGILRKELGNSLAEFNELISEGRGVELKRNDSLKSYEKRIDMALTLQYSASYIVSLAYRLLVITKERFKDYRLGSKEYTAIKSGYDELNSMIEIYKNHVYTFSQRAKVLSETLKIKQMANPDISRFDIDA